MNKIELWIIRRYNERDTIMCTLISRWLEHSTHRNLTGRQLIDRLKMWVWCMRIGLTCLIAAFTVGIFFTLVMEVHGMPYVAVVLALTGLFFFCAEELSRAGSPQEEFVNELKFVINSPAYRADRMPLSYYRLEELRNFSALQLLIEANKVKLAQARPNPYNIQAGYYRKAWGKRHMNQVALFQVNSDAGAYFEDMPPKRPVRAVTAQETHYSSELLL